MQKIETLKTEDIDKIEDDIFTKLSNMSKGIALDVFHPRLVANANIKHSGQDKYGVPIKNENSFLNPVLEH